MMWVEILEKVNEEVDQYVIANNTEGRKSSLLFIQEEQKPLAILALVTCFVNFNAEAFNYL